jgi:hypothetical protein
MKQLTLRQLLDGQGWMDERTMLEAQLTTGNQRQDARRFPRFKRRGAGAGAIAKLIQINASINDQPLANYRRRRNTGDSHGQPRLCAGGGRPYTLTRNLGPGAGAIVSHLS